MKHVSEKGRAKKKYGKLGQIRLIFYVCDICPFLFCLTYLGYKMPAFFSRKTLGDVGPSVLPASLLELRLFAGAPGAEAVGSRAAGPLLVPFPVGDTCWRAGAKAGEALGSPSARPRPPLIEVSFSGNITASLE